VNKQDYINSIRDEYSGMKDMPRESLASSLETLAHDLYAKDSHFIFELIQNAEDNNYPDKTAAQLRFEVCQFDIDGQKTTSLIVHNNETGFNDKNVRAICQVGQSTKKKAQGYIGEKGIGFKSVFRITASPYIFSNGFQFCLPEKDEETGLGYIVPSWVLNPPKEISTEETSIILPLNKNIKDAESVITALRDVAPETILFLKKLEKLEISVCLSDSTSTYNLVIEKKVVKTIDKSQLVELTCKKHETEKDDVFDIYSFWVTEIEFEKPDEVQHEKRIGIGTRVVSVAIPLDDKTTKGKLFAYLPVWEETGIPFLINADFLLVSSREGIREDEEWNKWLRDCVAKTYTSSLLALLKSNKIPFKTKIAGYASIPIETIHPFLKPVIEEIKNELSGSECVLTLPDKLLVKPIRAGLCNHNFRELLNATKTLPAHFINTIQIVCPEMETFSEGLKSVGVKIFTTQDIIYCLDDSDWLKSHELIWFVKLLRYLKSQTKLEPKALQKCELIPVKALITYRLSCVEEQPIYFPLDEDNNAALKDAPEWLSELAPICELDTNFQKLLNVQKDNDELIKWMTETLRIHVFSKVEYCDAVCKQLILKYIDEMLPNKKPLNAEKIFGTTQWLEQNAGEKFNWEILPVVLSDGQKMLLMDALKRNIVVPETYDQESGWQNIWASSSDRSHFISFSNSYGTMPKEWFEKLGIKKFPGFKTIDYTLTGQLPTSTPEVGIPHQVGRPLRLNSATQYD